MNESEKMNTLNKVILTDVDGVLLNWEYAFKCWMEMRGYNFDPNTKDYNISHRYGISREEGKRLVRIFNESSAIGFLPPLRDAMYYVDLLHRKMGYTFHAITSLSLDPYAAKLREENLRKLFGDTAFTKVQCIDTGADKDEALAPYKDSGLLWVEDKPENAVCGYNLGLNSILMAHSHNINFKHEGIPKIKGWQGIYEMLSN